MRPKQICFCAGLVGLALASLFLLSPNPARQRLRDGSVISLVSLKFGQTNEFTHGTFLAKTLGTLIPSNGIHFAGFKLRRASKTPLIGWRPVLVAELRIRPGKRPSAIVQQLTDRNSHGKFRLIVTGDDGFDYVESLSSFDKFDDGYFSYPSMTAFPREAKQLRFQIEQRDKSGGTWQTVARLVRDNPARAKPEPWRAVRCRTRRLREPVAEPLLIAPPHGDQIVEAP